MSSNDGRLVTRRNVAVGLGAALLAGATGMGFKLYRRDLKLGTGRSRALGLSSDAQLPAQADVVIVGGGVTGAMAALCLAERGLKVALCEKGVIGGESSSRATGMIDSLFLNPAKAELVLRAKALWPELNARINGDTGYVRSGVALVLQSDEEAAGAQAWVDAVQGQAGLDPVVLPRGKLLTLGAAANDHGVLYQPSDAQAEPRFVATAMALGARAKGATLHQQCAVRGIERSAGAVSAVVTESGVIKTKVVIVAGGAWTPLLCGNEGLSLPQLYAFASNQRVTAAPQGPTPAGICQRTLWRREPEGTYCVGYFGGLAPVGWDAIKYGVKFLKLAKQMPETTPAIGPESWRSLTMAHRWQLDERTPFEDIRIMDPLPNTQGLDEALSSARQIHPGLAQVQAIERYAGALTTTPDNMPVISPVQSVPGLILGTGLYFGLTVAPAAGELLADLATGATPHIDPKPFRYERLIDGSRLQIQL